MKPGRVLEDMERLKDGLSRSPSSPETRGLALRLSETLEQEGKTEQAIRLLRTLSAAAPRDPELALSLARLLQRSGRAEEALACYSAPGASSQSKLEGARLLIDQGRFQEADSFMQAVVSGGSPSADVSMTLGRLRRWQGRLDEAVAAYRDAIERRPQDPQPYLFLAESLMRSKRLDEMFVALRAGSAASRSAGGIPSLLDRYRLAACALDFEEAARLGEAVLDATRTTWDLEPLLWLVFIDEFDFTERPSEYVSRGLEAVERFLKAHPEAPWGYCWRGLLRELDPAQKGDAPADFRRVEAFPEQRYGWMRFKSAVDRLYSGDLAGARAQLRVVARSSTPGHWKAQCLLSETLLYSGDRKGARESFSSVELWAPGRDVPGGDPGECLAWKGKLLLWTGDFEAAARVLDLALSHATYDAQCWKGGALVCLGRYEEALRWLERAVSFRFTPTYVEARLWRSEAMYRSGRFEEALCEAQVAIDAEPQDFYPYLLRGLSRAALGDAQGAAGDAARVPATVVAFLSRTTGREGMGPVALMEGILKASGGFRCYRPSRPFELKVWMH